MENEIKKNKKCKCLVFNEIMVIISNIYMEKTLRLKDNKN